jgi:hypothetical protein
MAEGSPGKIKAVTILLLTHSEIPELLKWVAEIRKRESS